MALKKTCYRCGIKTEKLYESLCMDCFQEEFPAVKEIKPINLKICNSCGRIHYGNGLYTEEQIEKLLPDIIRKNTVINENYVLDEINYDDFHIEKSKIAFDIHIKTHIKEN